MELEIWFEYVDNDEFETLKFHENYGAEEPEIAIIPNKGDNVGIWQSEHMKEHDPTAYLLHYVVDVRHFITPEKQEIHILCSSHP